ncbi:nitrite reductase small subunit NirD [Azohydromonas caseinilytica]|uniref:Nitrite reductase small subunit NirD n=1 Tax=Azohydromonas caseinilytica TaxID=2728836 RepID=A0A848F8H6_9BURK|nr:nitrite reductase small subunit NirD [Azohydromonas caseinilytica]NML14341.1 nitrite reductase small subunit NirD [Azohydromonas caseinilytica]
MEKTWTPVCAVEDILPNTGVCALVQERHVAVFRIEDDVQRLYAIDNYDPNAQASVLSRGLVGNLGARIVVASPIYKHHFDLQSGECLEAPENSVRAYPVRIDHQMVCVGV